MFMKKVIIIIVALTVVLVGVRAYQYNSRKSEKAKTIKIGAIFDQTGDVASYGEDELKSVKLAVEEINGAGGINGRKIELIPENAPALDVRQNISAFNKLVDVDGVVAIIGPNWDDAVSALIPLAEKAKIPVVSPDPDGGQRTSKDVAHEYYFSLWYPQDVEAEKLADFLSSREVKKIDILRNLDPFSQKEYELIKGTTAKYHIALVSDIQVVDSGVKDFRSQIIKLKADKVDAVFVNFQNPEAKCPALKQLGDLAFDKIIIGESSTETISCKDLLEGTFYSFPNATKKSQDLNARFVKKYGVAPKTPAVPNAYDATIMIADALRGGNLTGTDIKDYLKNLKTFDGALGPSISFDSQNNLKLTASDFVIKTIKNGNIQIVP